MNLEPTRFSHLKKFQQSASHYQHAVKADRVETLALRMGSGTHAVMFGQPYHVYEGRRAGKAWEEFEASLPGETILNAKEFATALNIAAAVRSHPVAARLLFAPDAITEERIFWEMDGRAIGSTPDVRTDAYIVDLKTTKCAEPEKFMRDAFWRGYHAQLSFYAEAVKAHTGIEVPDLYIVAVESAPPHPVVVMRLTPAARLAGTRRRREQNTISSCPNTMR